jgi:putative membrane protein
MMVRMMLGVPNPEWATFASTFACFLFAILHAGTRLGWKKALTLLVLCFVISLFFESVGVATGWVYGPYHYSAKLGAKFLGLVPYLIPLVWFMMMYPAFLMARWLTPHLHSRLLQGLCLAALAGMIMTAWDLTMDPLMVKSGNWIWEIPGAYFGIPIQNFWGWWLTTFVTFGAFLLIWPTQLDSRPAEKVANARWDRWVFLSYLVIGLGTGVAVVVEGLSGSALVGLFAMAPWLLLSWWKTAAAIDPTRME